MMEFNTNLGRRMKRPLSSCVVLVGFAALVARGQDQQPDTSAWLTVQPGTVPVIISAPHGGRKPIPNIPERQGVNVAQFVKARDENTAEIAEQCAAELAKHLGGKPWLVVARFERKQLDANRPAAGSYESDAARPFYEAYHKALEAACKAVKEKYGRGLLLDIHGQAGRPDAICRGTQNLKTVTLLRERYGKAAVVGKDSVLGRLEQAGYAVFPKGDSDEKEDARYNGGYIVQTYGSHAGYAIDALQLELGSTLRKKDAVAKTAKDLAAAVKAFHDAYLKDGK
jgi:N-formylglutamate amidohydrolase